MNNIKKDVNSDVLLGATDEKNTNKQSCNDSAFTLVRQDNAIAHLVMDVVGDTMNTLKAEFAEQVAEVLAEIKSDTTIKGVVLCSGKKDSFVAGADINMINNCNTKEDVMAMTRQGQMLFSQLELLVQLEL